MQHSDIVHPLGERAKLHCGDQVRISVRWPVGHYRMPIYLRGKTGRVERIMEPKAVDNEEEGYGRNAGSKRHYYRVVFPLTEIWPDYAGFPNDRLHIEVFETWLERV